VARKTTTTTVIRSEKSDSGEWEEWEKTVTTVVERDEEGLPYGPIIPYPGPKHLSQQYFYDGFLRPRSKPRKQEDGQDG
jgi:hypothetical protein